MFPANQEALLAALTVEEREIAEDTLDGWEAYAADEQIEVTEARKLKVLRQIVALVRANPPLPVGYDVFDYA